MKQKAEKRHNCKWCGAHVTWLNDDWGLKELVNVPFYTKHICLKTKKSPIELAVAKTKPQPEKIVESVTADGEIILTHKNEKIKSEKEVQESAGDGPPVNVGQRSSKSSTLPADSSIEQRVARLERLLNEILNILKETISND